jgi:hypothetical protein
MIQTSKKVDRNLHQRRSYSGQNGTHKQPWLSYVKHDVVSERQRILIENQQDEQET